MTLRTLVAALVVTAASATLAQSQGGAFKDAGGKSHPWAVQPNHVLSWEGKPYSPAGMVFCPRWLALGQTEANWTADAADLEVARARGLQDLVIDPVVSLVDLPPAALQRLLDQLETGGFRYGLAFGAGITTPLTGTAVRPAGYRLPGLKGGSEAVWQVPGADTARYYVASELDGSQIVAEGTLKATDGVFSLSLGTNSSEGLVAILYPHKAAAPAGDLQTPNVWSGYDSYRDRLLGLLRQVKFGPGFRFFLDPLGNSVGVTPEADYLIPDSAGFRVEWEAYLSRRYPTIAELMTAWGVTEREIKDVPEAATLTPLWADAKGLPMLVNPDGSKRYGISPARTSYWADLRECRNDSLVYAARALATVLKRQVADAPVVYTRTQQHRMFTNDQKDGGFDGLAVRAFGRGTALVTGGADAAYGQAEDAARPMWFIVSQTATTASPTKAEPGYASRQAMAYDLDWLRGIGARAIYALGLNVEPASRYPNFSLARVPDQMDWLKEYGAKMAQDTGVAKPHMLPYPAAAAGIVHSGPIGNKGVWWTPSMATGHVLPFDFGCNYAGYTILMPEGDTTVLWSVAGARQTRLYATDPRKIQVTTADGAPIIPKLDAKNHTALVTIDETPVLIRGGGENMFPIEVCDDIMRQARKLIGDALDAKLPAHEFKYALDSAETKYKLRDYTSAYAMARQGLAGAIDIVRPYTWRELEQADSTTFTEVVPTEAASAGSYIAVNAAGTPSAEGYTVQISLAVPADDTYAVWLAASPQGTQSSPFTWMMDTSTPQPGADAKQVGAPFLGDLLAWQNLGTVKLSRGTHTFTLKLTARAEGTGRYQFAADALLLTRKSFTPRGTARPSTEAP